MSSCCGCAHGVGGGPQGSLPMLCLVPRDGSRPGVGRSAPQPRQVSAPVLQDFQFLTDDYIKEHFDLPPRALYLDPRRTPLITFPMNQEAPNGMFNVAKKWQINKAILDGAIDPSEAINMTSSVFPYPRTDGKQQVVKQDDEEIIYILQLPDYESTCPVHNKTIKTPRFIWHSCKSKKEEQEGSLKPGKGPLHRPKPWLLSRHTDFDIQSKW